MSLIIAFSFVAFQNYDLPIVILDVNNSTQGKFISELSRYHHIEYNLIAEDKTIDEFIEELDLYNGECTIILLSIGFDLESLLNSMKTKLSSFKNFTLLSYIIPDIITDPTLFERTKFVTYFNKNIPNLDITKLPTDFESTITSERFFFFFSICYRLIKIIHDFIKLNSVTINELFLKEIEDISTGKMLLSNSNVFQYQLFILKYTTSYEIEMDTSFDHSFNNGEDPSRPSLFYCDWKSNGITGLIENPTEYIGIVADLNNKEEIGSIYMQTGTIDYINEQVYT